MANVLVLAIKEHNTELRDCRGQSYDRAVNMAGRYSGLQARSKDANPLVGYVLCSAHSLNMLWCAPLKQQCFAFVQMLYNLFLASSNRWEILMSYLVRCEGWTLTLLKSSSAIHSENCWVISTQL